jgi:hypothetical protein
MQKACKTKRKMQRQQQKQASQNRSSAVASFKRQKFEMQQTILRRAAKNASCAWVPGQCIPVHLFVVKTWDIAMCKSVVLPRNNKNKITSDLFRNGLQFLRIRVMLDTQSHDQSVPSTAAHKPLWKCTNDDRLVDVGYVSYVLSEQCVTTRVLINSDALLDGTLSLFRLHMYTVCPLRYQCHPTSVHIMLADRCKQSEHRDGGLGVRDGCIKIRRSASSCLSNQGVMVLFLCVAAEQLWCTAVQQPLSYPPFPVRKTVIDLGNECGGWAYASVSSMLAQNSTNTVSVYLSDLPWKVPDRTNPVSAVSCKCMWLSKIPQPISNAVATHPRSKRFGISSNPDAAKLVVDKQLETEVTLQSIEDAITHTVTMLEDFTLARKACATAVVVRPAPAYGLWFTQYSNMWTQSQAASLSSVAVLAARQLMLGAAAAQSLSLCKMAVKDWVKLCECMLICLIEQEDANATAFVLKTSEKQYKTWKLTPERTVSMLCLLESTAGRKLVATRKVCPVKGGMVHVDGVSGLALAVTLEHLAKDIYASCISSAQYRKVQSKLQPHARRWLVRYTTHLQSRSWSLGSSSTTSPILDIRDSVKMETVQEFLQQHGGSCVVSMLTGSHSMANDQRYRLMSILYPYVQLGAIMEFMKHRLWQQRHNDDNEEEKTTQMSDRFKYMRITVHHKRKFLEPYCLRKGESHACVYQYNHTDHLSEALKKALRVEEEEESARRLGCS